MVALLHNIRRSCSIDQTICSNRVEYVLAFHKFQTDIGSRLGKVPNPPLQHSNWRWSHRLARHSTFTVNCIVASLLIRRPSIHPEVNRPQVFHGLKLSGQC